MNDRHDLSDDQCDRLVALTMDKLAAKHSDQYGTTHALDLNPSITEHHSLRRGIVRAAYELGKLAGSTAQRLGDEPDEGDLWSFLRTVMAQGVDIALDAQRHGWGYEARSARLDAAAAYRAQELVARLKTPNTN